MIPADQSTRLRVFVLLLAVFVYVCSVSSQVVEHVDFTNHPAIIKRNCVERTCQCGTQPELCKLENDLAKCRPCPDGKYQAHSVSSRDIDTHSQCQLHKECRAGL